MSDSTAYRNDIQGLRALAVAPVVLYHADGRLLPGGFVGVDMFFVISGYLITQILLREIETGTFSVRRFYERRVRRLFPALFVMLAAVLIWGFMILSPEDFDELASTALATIVFASNAMFFSLSDYFEGPAELKPLLHTWSLAVEEQFYLVFPLVLAGMARFAPRLLKPLLWIGSVGSLALCILLTRSHQMAAFYLPMTRAWELLAGALIAAGAVPAVRGQLARDGLSLIGLVLIGASLVLIDRSMRFPGVLALAPVLGTALVIHAGQGGATAGGRLLSLPPLVWLGALSYSLYLWHWPLMAYARYTTIGEPEPVRLWLAAAAAVPLALASLIWIERPAQKARLSGSAILSSGGLAMATAAVACFIIMLGKGIPDRFAPEVVALFEASKDSSPHRDRCHGNGWELIPYEENCQFGAEGAAPRIVVWGDSFGTEFAVALGEREGAQGRAVMQITASACPPAQGFSLSFRPRCRVLTDATLKALMADTRVERVVLMAHYDRYRPDIAGLMAGLHRTAVLLGAAGKQVTLVDPIPSMPSDAPRALGLTVARGGDPGAFGADRAAHAGAHAEIVAALESIAADGGASRLDPAEKLCDVRLCPAWRADAGVLYFDDVHLSLAGARLLVGGADGVARAE